MVQRLVWCVTFLVCAVAGVSTNAACSFDTLEKSAQARDLPIERALLDPMENVEYITRAVVVVPRDTLDDESTIKSTGSASDAQRSDAKSKPQIENHTIHHETQN